MKVLELFAGAGGAALGLENAGGEHLACVELDEDACATLEAAGLPAVHGDVRDLSLYEGLQVDLLWSSFPCQAWSTAGKRKGADDDRNGWPWTVDVTAFVEPTWFVGENVVGLTNHKGACNRGRKCIGKKKCPAAYFHEVILSDLERRFDWVGWTVLNSSSFGVPQHRRRVCIVAGPHPIKWPEATHGDPNTPQADMFRPALKPWSTVRDALGLSAWSTATGMSGDGVPGIPKSPDTPSCQPVAGGKALGGLYGWDEVQLDGGRNSDNNPGQERPHTLEEPAPTINGKGNQMLRVIGGGSNPHGPGRGHERNYRDLSEGPCTTITASQIGNAGPWVVSSKWHKGKHPELLDKPSAVVSATEYKGTNGKESTGWTANGGPSRASDTLWLSTGRRRLTVDECARLMDFPSGYPFQGETKQSRYRQVGNAVTPIVAQKIAEQIMNSGGMKNG